MSDNEEFQPEAEANVPSRDMAGMLGQDDERILDCSQLARDVHRPVPNRPLPTLYGAKCYLECSM
jgi:hypothetical protein